MSRRLLTVVAMAAAALFIGAATSITVMLLAGWRYVPERTFELTVELEPAATEAQKSAIRSELESASADVSGEVRFETREEALARFREQWKDDPERVAGVQVESMSESFRWTAEAREFDCTPVPAIRQMSGVDRLWVVGNATAGRPAVEIGC
ncbi:permease-like cell division protein FtsX [Actinoplanes sp. DH11]|uniref:permease-like cell division protein FtsX n=1 Tax=Actinoplanes sp. DH11 TaxID=2857011 RepID=UPI001E3846DD|nr:permease-like cell division protein FtsX [Actinoplanes sp. DH11]